MAADTVGEAGDEPEELTSRLPTVADLVAICRRLNELGARYIVVGGFAVWQAGYPRETGDIDLLVDTELENEARVLEALEVLPDKASREIEPGEIEEYNVVRVADEVVVDLMKAACGIRYADAVGDVVIVEEGGVRIPFASPRLLWRTKQPLGREKDAGDLVFLRALFRQLGQEPPG